MMVFDKSVLSPSCSWRACIQSSHLHNFASLIQLHSFVHLLQVFSILSPRSGSKNSPCQMMTIGYSRPLPFHRLCAITARSERIQQDWSRLSQASRLLFTCILICRDVQRSKPKRLPVPNAAASDKLATVLKASPPGISLSSTHSRELICKQLTRKSAQASGEKLP